MYNYTLDALSTRLEILSKNRVDDNDISTLFLYIQNFEQKYSRFIPKNHLDCLNNNSGGEIDIELYTMLSVAQKLHHISQWYFDITLSPLLSKLGYGDSSAQNHGQEHMSFTNTSLLLKNWVYIELGSLWKWYLIDYIYKSLAWKYSDFTINFWGDIRISWNNSIWLEDPLDSSRLIWKIKLENMAFASSSGQKRTFWKNKHHLINPKNQDSAFETLAVYVTHASALLADWYASCLWVCPLEISIQILENTSWLEAIIITSDGKIIKSKGFDVELY